MVNKKPALRMMFKGLKIDERTQDYIEKRLQKVQKPLDNILKIEVEVDMDKKGKFRVEVMVETPYKMYRAEETTESVEGSIDIVCDELYEQIVRDKDKIKDLRKRGGRSLKKKIVVDENARFRK